MVIRMTAETMELEFNTEEITKAEEEYKKLQLDPAQQEIIDSLTDLLADIVPIPKLAVKGFTWQVMNNWQRMRRITMTELLTRPKIDRVNATKELIKQAKKFYVSLLLNATPKQKEVLEKGFDMLLRQSSDRLTNLSNIRTAK